MHCSFILIDENPNTANVIQEQLKTTHPLVLVKCFTETEKACSFLKENTIDFVLIDPNFTSSFNENHFEQLLLNQVVVFLSARMKDAVKAFDLGAFDFLGKPFNIERLLLTVQKLEALQEKGIQHEVELKNYIDVRCNLMSERLFHHQILFIEAMGDYVRFVTDKKKYVVLMSMKKAMDILPGQSFFRTHKSFIVNTHKIDLYNGKEVHIQKHCIPISRFKKKEFKERFAIH